MYAIISAIFLFFIGITWSSRDLKNIVLKIIFIDLAIWGGFEFLTAAGYVTKG